MNNPESSNTIVRFLKNAGSHGLHGIELKRLSAMPEEAFNLKSKHLWDQGLLSGIPEENCCGRGCRFMCVSYREEERVWRLMEFTGSEDKSAFSST